MGGDGTGFNEDIDFNISDIILLLAIERHSVVDFGGDLLVEG